DPRDASLETTYVTPKTWFRDTTVHGLGASGMFLSGLIMVTRNRCRFLFQLGTFAWPSVLFRDHNMINTHPLRAKEGGSGWSNVALCFSGFSRYIPLFIITNTPKV
ncbi:hypothetical protein BJ912DRAFT_852205, partial [Pholiota molesta]